MAPLLQPSECSILIVDPRSQHIGELDQQQQQSLIRRFEIIESAASATAVPCHYVLDQDGTDPHVLLPPHQPAGGHLHISNNSGPSWLNSGIAAALSASRRHCVVLCGFWLETSLTFTALYALSGGFDVFVLMDASPSQVDEARGPSSDRLLQAGAVPSTTHQLIAEWAEQSADINLRRDLYQLIYSQ